VKKLLEEASRLFRKKDMVRAKLTCYDFSLSKMPYGWIFQVTNSWQKWLEKDLEYKFGAYKKPEHAVIAFLDYVKVNNIKVRKLMS